MVLQMTANAQGAEILAAPRLPNIAMDHNSHSCYQPWEGGKLQQLDVIPSVENSESGWIAQRTLHSCVEKY